MAPTTFEGAVEARNFRAAGEAQPANRDTGMTIGPVELSIVMPCLNEVRTLAACIRKARRFLDEHGVSGEIIVADNGSTDGSVDLASSLGVRVLSVSRRGYGAALKGGIEAARGRWVIMGDSDDSYDFSALQPFLNRLRAGDDLVVGNRFRGGIAPGAMPFLHRSLGNPFFSWWVRTIVGAPLRDVYCGLRGFRREAIEHLDLQSSGMELALEMIITSTLLGMRISEVPTTLVCDGRDRPPHLNTWRDGCRGLFLLLASTPQIPFYRRAWR
jgi:glycosyltransferase involved in cell wall biosynthesis